MTWHTPTICVQCSQDCEPAIWRDGAPLCSAECLGAAQALLAACRTLDRAGKAEEKAGGPPRWVVDRGDGRGTAHATRAYADARAALTTLQFPDLIPNFVRSITKEDLE